MKEKTKILAIIFLIFISGSLYKNIEYINGDINLDNKVDIMDILEIQRYNYGYNDLNEYQFKIADVNNDGILNYNDMSIIKSYIIDQ